MAMFLPALLSALAVLAGSNLAVTAETSLTLDSSPGDYVGNGQQYAYDLSTATFTPTLLNAGNGARIFVSQGNLQQWWYLNFGAADGAPLGVGTYVDAMRYSVQDPGRPGIDVFGNGRGCNRQAGAFQVKQLTVANGAITRLWVRFEQHCEGAQPALTGDLRYNADVSVLVVSPMGRTLPIGDTLRFDVHASSTGSDPVTLTATGVPPGAVFVDHGDDTGTFTWTPTEGQVGTYAVNFSGVSASGQDVSTTIVKVTERPLTGETSLRLESEAGDRIGGGQSRFFGASDGTFTGYWLTGNQVASFTFSGSMQSWSLRFTGPNSSMPAPGLYLNARRWPGGARPGLDVSGNGRGCNMLDGMFEVKQFVIEGTTISRFWVRFEQHCEGAEPALTGELRLNADVTVAVNAPLHARVERASPSDIEVTATAADGGHVALSVVDPPPGATFEDRGNNTGRLRWTPSVDQLGVHTVVFVGTDNFGHEDRSTTLLEVKGLTSLQIDSERDEPLAHGAHLLFTKADGDFSASEQFNDKSVTFRFQSEEESWTVVLDAPGMVRLAPGNYEDAVGYPFGSGAQPRLRVSGRGTGCNDLRGRFVVRQAGYNSDGRVTALWATFEETCTGFVAPLRGELRFNASVITDISAPASDTLAPGEPLMFTVTATNAAGRHVALSASGLPDGAHFVDHGDHTGTFSWTPTFDQMGRHRLSFRGEDGAGGVDSAATYILVPGDTRLIIDEGPSGPQVRTLADGLFTGIRNAQNLLRLHFVRFGEHRGWDLDFGAPGNAVLEPGFYPGASVVQVIGGSAPAPTYPVLDVDEHTFIVNCTETRGLFQVKQASYGDGGEIERFWARFEQHCSEDGARQVGEIRFNARVETVVQAPLSAEVEPGHALEIPVRATDRLNRHVTLTAVGLPDGAKFVDHGDGTGVMTWKPGLGALGLHDVMFIGTTVESTSDSSSTHIRVPGQIRLIVDGDESDPVGRGRHAVFGPGDGPMELWKNYKEGVSLKFRENTGGFLSSWYLDLSAPYSAPLGPGLYEPVEYFPYNAPGVAGLAVNHGNRPCSSTTGRFEVQEVTYGPGVEIASLRATFEQHCGTSEAAVRGEIRWNYDAPILVYAPGTLDTTDGSPLRLVVTGVDRTGGVLAFSATGLPDGAEFEDGHDNTGVLTWTPARAQVGDHVVTFHAMNATGETDSARTTIRVRHIYRPPVAVARFSQPAIVGEPVMFDASGSFDPDGDPLRYVWIFGDGAYALTMNATHTYTSVRTYTLSLRVSDPQMDAYAETLVTVVAVQPARAYLTGGDRVVRPETGKPTLCIQIEPIGSAWSVENARLETFEMTSIGTGSADRIPVRPEDTSIDRDRDHNAQAELRVCFSKEDVRRLLDGVSQRRSNVPVIIQGRLASADVVRAALDVPVALTGAPGSASAVETNETFLPSELGLWGLPNPFAGTTSVRFDLPEPVEVRLTIHDVAGRRVRTLASGVMAPGRYERIWDARDDDGNTTRPGIYLARLAAGQRLLTRRLVRIP